MEFTACCNHMQQQQQQQQQNICLTVFLDKNQSPMTFETLKSWRDQRGGSFLILAYYLFCTSTFTYLKNNNNNDIFSCQKLVEKFHTCL